MSVKTKASNKFYITQFILNNYTDFNNWYTDNKIEALLKSKAMLGYLFTTKKGIFLNDATKILNVYLIDRNHYKGTEITKDMLDVSWSLFFNDNKNIFVNPPIETWLDSKDNWCKKLATKLSNQYCISFNEALSEVYLAVMKCYRKNTIYMGNLNYISKAANTNILMNIRNNKNRVNQDSGLAVSLDTIITESSADDEELALIDIIPSTDADIDDELNYKELLDKAKAILSKVFSDREIDQILTQKSNFLPRSLYSKLLRWRGQHNIKELYNEKAK